MSELDEYVIQQNQTPEEVIEVIENQKATAASVIKNYKTVADFKPTFTSGIGPLHAKYPFPCGRCGQEHSVGVGGAFCADCCERPYSQGGFRIGSGGV